ncbi:hypothetical protein ARTHRO9AX_200018 [Arthrobacter sp. 9AX]|nr:hypothetical protein ARTHRO9AX_200018 [Arthrobacter sp. 9AX]
MVHLRQGMPQAVPRVLGDLTGGSQRDAVVHHQCCCALQAVARPAQLQPRHGEDARCSFEGVPGGIHEIRFDAVHQPPPDAAHRSPQEHQDGGGYQQSHDGVGQGEAEHNAGRAQHHGKGGEAVGPGVHTVCHQGCGADPAAYPDAVNGHRLVAGEADQARGEYPPQIGERLGVQEAVDRLPCGNDGRECHDPHDEQPRKVLRPAEAVGVAAGGGAAAQDEGDPQRHGGEGVGEVVDGVGQERHGAADQHHEELQDGGAQKQDKADFQGTDAFDAGFHGVVNGVRGVVGVRDEQLEEPAFEAAVVGVVVSVVVLVVSV